MMSPPWALAAGMLVAEYVALSLLVDFPTSGPAMQLVSLARTAVPGVLGAGAAGFIVLRHARSEGLGLVDLPGRHPRWGGVAAHLVAFVATALLAWRLLGPGAPPLEAAAFAAWMACAGVTVLLAAGIVAPMGVLARIAIRHLQVPLFALALGLLSWRSVATAERLWGVLQGRTLGAAAALLRLLSPNVLVVPEESVIGLGGFEVEVAPVCSGVDGLGLVLVFQAVWLSLARSRIRLGRALLLLVPAGMAAALGANVIRIAVLVVVGASGHEDLALGAFHSKLGWLLFVGIALASVTIAEHAPFLRREAAPLEAAFPATAKAYVGPLVVALGAALVTSLWADRGFDRYYGARVAAAALALILARPSLPRPALTFSWMPWLVAGAVCAAWIPWGGMDGSTLEQALSRLGRGERTLWIAARLVGSCLVLPIAEELAFRGFLLPWLVSPDLDVPRARSLPWPAILLSSLAFGALHEHWLLGSAAGAAFAVVRMWRGRLGDAIVAHVACNAGIAAAVLLGGRWDLWG